MDTISAQLASQGVGLPDDGWHDHRGVRHPDASPAPMDVGLDKSATYGAMLRQLAMWCGDDGKAQAYWLHFCEAEGIWSLRDNRNSTSVVVEFDTLERVEDKRIVWLEPSPPLRKAPWLDGITDHVDALIAILTAVGKGEVSR